jgi:AcrR family transcriptional regulator
MSKGDLTRDTILEAALELASEVGFEGLTIGTLAGRVKLSKSGLYAHFASKEDLQGRVLEVAGQHFVDRVLRRAIREPRGLPRVQALFEHWVQWVTADLRGGCPFLAAAIEYDDRPGPLRDRLVKLLDGVLESVAKAARLAIEQGHLRADLDVDQFAFEFWAIVQGYHHYARLFRRADAMERARRAFDGLLRDALPR